MNLSIVIPVYNSGEIISILVEKISDHIKSNNLNTEIILVNDFSKDSSWKKIKILHRKYSYVKGINLQNNYQESAPKLQDSVRKFHLQVHKLIFLFCCKF